MSDKLVTDTHTQNKAGAIIFAAGAIFKNSTQIVSLEPYLLHPQCIKLLALPLGPFLRQLQSRSQFWLFGPYTSAIILAPV